MDNLTYHQHKMLDKLYGPLEKKDPSTELSRLSKLYRLHGVYQEPGYIKERFQVSINSQLHRYLQSKSQFYNFDYFKAHYKMLAGDFIEDNIDANEKDFIDEYIISQQEIIDKTFRHFITIEGYKSLELVQFVDKDFFDDFIRSSKKKIEFLKSLSIVQENTPEIKPDRVEEKKRITVKNNKIFRLIKILNLQVEFLREDFTPEDFINALTSPSAKDIHLNINNRNFHYLLTKIDEYFFNFNITAVAKTNKIHSKTGKLLAAKNLRNSKVDSPRLKNEIDEAIINFR